MRVFDAPRERVWREWTEPDAFADWFGGVAIEVPLSTVSMDLRAGRQLARDDVLRPGSPRDPLDGRVPARLPRPSGSSSRSPTSPARTATSS